MYIQTDPMEFPSITKKEEDLLLPTLAIGKVSFESKKIFENAEEFIKAIIKLKPSSTKGNYIKSIFMSSTMSPSISIDYKI